MLINCDECGGQVSDKADICPHCGANSEIFLGPRLRCTECGASVRSAHKSCSECGAPRRFFEVLSGASRKPKPEIPSVVEAYVPLDEEKNGANGAFNRGRTTSGLWARYCAKQIDAALFLLPAVLATQVTVMIAVPNMVDYNGEFSGPWQVYGVITLFYVAIIEAISISAFRSTIGKALAGISITAASGGRLNLWRSVARSIRVVIQGLGLGIPLIALITQIVAFQYVQKNGAAGWDKDANASYLSKPIGSLRWFFLIAFSICGLGLMVALSVAGNMSSY